jgi:GDP-mannose 4,6-dehydratase
MGKVAIITGVTGQDGSYLAEFLCKKDYKVIGLARRSSVNTHERLNKVSDKQNFMLLESDLTDPSSINYIVNRYKPDEVYNLAAQSHVQTSFSQPVTTFSINTVGVLNFLDAIKTFSPHTKFYQASTSEMFGSNFSAKLQHDGKEYKYQDENTQFAPNSPYAVAKLAAHQLVGLYRKSYDVYGACGILFNHECFKYDMPIMIKVNNRIEIRSIEETALHYLENIELNKDIYVWSNNTWVKIKTISWFHNKDKKLIGINTRNGVIFTSHDHKFISENNQNIVAETIQCGDRLLHGKFPSEVGASDVSLQEAELLGMLAGDGAKHQFTNKDKVILNKFDRLWVSVTGGRTQYYPSVSGFTGEEVGRLNLHGGSWWLKKFQIYSSTLDTFGHQYKQIPIQILNSNTNVMEAFLTGYNLCDGLKANTCKYKFKNFKTNSPILAQGLLYLISVVTGQRFNITIEQSFAHRKQQIYYSINLLSDREGVLEKYHKVSKLLSSGLSQRGIYAITGISRKLISKIKNGYIPTNIHHLELPSNEVKKIVINESYDGLFFDIETENNMLNVGIGTMVVHNSERRGENFVTRKITKYVGDLHTYKKSKDGLKGVFLYDSPIEYPKLKLGNLDAYRDWGYAPDYVEAMWMMLQYNKPDDFIIGTGEAHSVREFVEQSFKVIGIKDWEKYVEIDPQFYRPCEVEFLCGNSRKAKEKLGWSAKTNFESLVRKMVQYDAEENR